MKKSLSMLLIFLIALLASCSKTEAPSSVPETVSEHSDASETSSSVSDMSSTDTSTAVSDEPTLSPEGVFSVYNAEDISFLDRTVRENGRSVVFEGSPLTGFSYYSECKKNSYVFHINGNLPVTDANYHGTYRFEHNGKEYAKREFYRGAVNVQEVDGKVYGIYLDEINCHTEECYYAEFYSDGTHTKLLDISNVYFGAERIYYYDYAEDTLCTANFDGTDVKTLCKVGGEYYFNGDQLFEYGEYLLYFNDANMMVMKPDGTHISLFENKRYMYLCGVRNDYVYAYERDKDTNQFILWRVRIDGGAPEKLMSTFANDAYYCAYFFIDNWLYGVNGKTICVFNSQLELESQYFFPEDTYIEQIDICNDCIAISSDSIVVYTRYGHKFIDMKTE